MDRILTVVGQGYVGLPLAQAAVHAGWAVRGLDVSSSIVAALNSGRSHVDDLDDEDITAMLDLGYRATTDPAVVSGSDVVVICVPTPLGENGGPDLSAVRSAAIAVGRHLVSGTTVVLESTTYPGTTEDILVPILESESGMSATRDFHVAFSPERINPGDKQFGVKNTPKLVGGVTPRSAESAAAFYEGFIGEVVKLSGTKEAETAKLLENTFRHVNIALVNEMSKFCHEMGIDVWEVIRGASTKPFGFMPFTPGPGVGGHCIPIDPNYLAYQVETQLGYPFRFVELAQEINNSMPRYIVDRITALLNDQGQAVRGTRILLLGVTYKPDIADQRESPAIPVAEKLQRLGADLRFHDPHVAEWRLPGSTLNVERDLDHAVDSSDLVVLLQAHSAYLAQDIAERAALFFDTRGTTTGAGHRL